MSSGHVDGYPSVASEAILATRRATVAPSVRPAPSPMSRRLLCVTSLWNRTGAGLLDAAPQPVAVDEDAGPGTHVLREVNRRANSLAIHRHGVATPRAEPALVFSRRPGRGRPSTTTHPATGSGYRPVLRGSVDRDPAVRRCACRFGTPRRVRQSGRVYRLPGSPRLRQNLIGEA